MGVSGNKFYGIEMKKVLMSFALLSAVAACAPPDVQNSDANMATKISGLTESTSNKRDVYAALGQPDDVNENSDGSVWIYYRLIVKNSATTYVPIFNLVAGGSNINTKVTTVFFDGRGRYKSNLAGSSNRYSNMWAGSGIYPNDPGAIPRVEVEMKKIAEPFDANHKPHISGS